MHVYSAASVISIPSALFRRRLSCCSCIQRITRRVPGRSKQYLYTVHKPGRHTPSKTKAVETLSYTADWALAVPSARWIMDERLLFDVVAAILLALTAAIGAYAPIWLSGGTLGGKAVHRSMAYSVGNMFSAGVMVSAGFCHLLADAERRLHSEGHFPLAPFLCALGFLLTLFADNVAHHLSKTSHGLSHGHCSHNSEAERPPPSRGGGANGVGGVVAMTDVRVLSQPTEAANESSGSLNQAAAKGNGTISQGHSPRVGDEVSSPFAANGYSEAAQRRVAKTKGGYQSLSTREESDDDIVVHGESAPLVSSISNLLQFEESASAREQPGGAVSFITAVLLGIALCFHSLLEGAAMGAEHTVSDSAHIFIAIIAHKGLAAYALGSSLLDARTTPDRYWAVVLSFVFSTPLGIFLGYLVSEVAAGDGTASISALAAGTFLYVAAMEVIPKELARQEHWLSKLVALMVGFFAMSLLAIWA